MLKILRNKKIKKRIYYILAIVIVPAFVFWGSAIVIQDRQSKNCVGKIFGKKISYTDYRNVLAAWRNQLKIRFGDNAYQMEKLLNPPQAIWDRLILLYEAKKRKIKVNNDELTKYVTSLPFLQKDGVFDPELYDLFLKYSLNTLPRVFEEEIRDTLKLQKLFEQITEYTKITEEEIKEKYRQEKEQIKVKYICVLAKDLEKEVNIPQEELKNYYEKHKDEFKTSIQINLDYIGIEYPKDAIEEEKNNINAKMEEIKIILNQENDFIKAKEKFKLEIKETGFFSLGEPIPEIGWIPTDIEAIFNLKEKQITDIIPTDKGSYIFQLKEKRTDYLPSFEETKEKIKNKLTFEKAKELAKNKMDDYYSKIKSKKEADLNLDLTKIAKQLSLTINETDFFNRQSYIPKIGFSKEFSDAAFKLEKDKFSEVIAAEQGYYVIELFERKEIDEKDFEKEKENLKQRFLGEKKNQAFEEFFEKLKQKANLTSYIEQAEKTSSSPQF